MKKIVNFRPILFLFLSLCFGILVSYAFLLSNVVLKVIGILFLTAMLVLLILSFFKNVSINLSKRKVFIILAIIFFVGGALNFYIQVNAFDKLKLNGQEYVIEAVVTDKMEIKDNKIELYLKNATAIRGENVYSLNKQIKLNFYLADFLEEPNSLIGKKVIFTGNVYDYTLIKNNEFNTYLYTSNLGYYVSVSSNNAVFFDGNKSISESIRLSVKNMLLENLSYDNAGLSYALLFGDKSLIENTNYENYSKSGIAHLLAVSGLNVGFLVIVCVFIFNALHMGKKWQFILLMAILTGYAYLCGFSASVVRATIMALTLLLGQLLGDQNDNLSNLSFSGIILLIISPVQLFTVGFLLSFLSVFGIFTLYPIFYKLLEKIKCPSWLNSAISITISAQIATLPVVASVFGEVNILSIFTNTLAILISTLGYVFLLVAVILTSILPIFSFLFILPDLAFAFVSLIARLVANIPFGTIKLFTFSLIESILYYSIIFILSQYTMLKEKIKLFTTLSVSAILVCILIFNNLPANFNSTTLTKLDYVAQSSLITTSENKTYLVDVGEGDKWDLYYIQKFLNSKKISTLSGLFLTNYDENKQTTVCTLSKEYNIKNVFIPYTENNILLYALVSRLPARTNLIFLNANETYIDYNLKVTSYVLEENAFALSFENNDISILFGDIRLKLDELNAVKDLINEKTQILVLEKLTPSMSLVLNENAYFSAVNYILVTENQGITLNSRLFDTNTLGHLQVKVYYDTLALYN